MKLQRKSGVLTILTLFFAAAAMLRILIGAEAVIAQDAAPPAVPHCPQPEAPAALLTALQQRESEAEAREAALDHRAEELEQARADLARQLAELEAAEAELAELVATYDKGAEPELTQLTAAYEAMKPEDAARLFTEMDPQFAAGFLARMSPQAAAGVLTGLDPALAYAMSVELAGRNARSANP